METFDRILLAAALTVALSSLLPAQSTVEIKVSAIEDCAVSNSVGVWFLFCGGVIFLIVSI